MLSPNGIYMKSLTAIMFVLITAAVAAYEIEKVRDKISETKTFVSEFIKS